jgi:hypothetical protein
MDRVGERSKCPAEKGEDQRQFNLIEPTARANKQQLTPPPERSARIGIPFDRRQSATLQATLHATSNATRSLRFAKKLNAATIVAVTASMP